MADGEKPVRAGDILTDDKIYILYHGRDKLRHLQKDDIPVDVLFDELYIVNDDIVTVRRCDSKELKLINKVNRHADKD